MTVWLGKSPHKNSTWRAFCRKVVSCCFYLKDLSKAFIRTVSGLVLLNLACFCVAGLEAPSESTLARVESCAKASPLVFSSLSHQTCAKMQEHWIGGQDCLQKAQAQHHDMMGPFDLKHGLLGRIFHIRVLDLVHEFLQWIASGQRCAKPSAISVLRSQLLQNGLQKQHKSSLEAETLSCCSLCMQQDIVCPILEHGCNLLDRCCRTIWQILLPPSVPE